MRRWYLMTSSSKAFWSPATVRSTSMASLSLGAAGACGDSSVLMNRNAAKEIAPENLT